MTAFEVMTRPLAQYGEAIADYGDEVNKAAPFCREWAGQTRGLTGPVLGQLAGPTRAVASGLAERYEALARNWVATGQQLTLTARSYRAADEGAQARLDATYPGGSGVHDAEADGRASLPALASHSWAGSRPPADPGAEARDSLSFEIKAVDWLFHKATGWHLTEPIDALAGNWKTLDAQADAYDAIRRAFLGFGDTMDGFATAADHVLDGEAASAFQTYARRFADGLRGEAEVAGAAALVLHKVSDEYGALYQGCVDIIQKLVRECETALAWSLAPGIGEAKAVQKIKSVAVKFLEARKLVQHAKRLVADLTATMANLQRAVGIYQKGAAGVAAVKAKIDFATAAVRATRDGARRAGNLSGLLHTPTSAYGGPSAPNYR